MAAKRGPGGKGRMSQSAGAKRARAQFKSSVKKKPGSKLARKARSTATQRKKR